MIWLDILSWLAFGAIVGLWEVWFHRRHSRFAEKTVIGMAGGLLGGALGKAVSGPADPVHIGRYDVLALVSRSPWRRSSSTWTSRSAATRVARHGGPDLL
jgi:uncharacterized membrane protein YeaQ/YmgE (transglycosylase-associated protein family)